MSVTVTFDPEKGSSTASDEFLPPFATFKTMEGVEVNESPPQCPCAEHVILPGSADLRCETRSHQSILVDEHVCINVEYMPQEVVIEAMDEGSVGGDRHLSK